jgi:endonuclease-3
MKQVTRSSTLARTKRRPPGRRGKETPAELRARARKIIARLERAYPDATCALQHRNALELLVATILSAQSTDARVNIVTPALFTKYRTAQDYASTDPKLFEEEIHSTGFFRNKTKSIIGMAQALVERHGGKVPDTMEQLVQLPGVGRKTANVVLGTWFGKNEGVVVDTHVQRLATLLGLTREQDPVKIERDLMALVPRAKWTWLSHTLILHGRRVCIARRPKCEECVVSRWCPSSRV